MEMALEHSVDLLQYTGNQYTESVNFCEVHWSTDSATISFLDYCDGSAIGTPREMQIIDVTSERIVQVTSLTPTNVPPVNSLFNAVLDAVWVNNTYLLMGVESVTGELNFSDSTITSTNTSSSHYSSVYNHQTQSVSVIDSRRLGLWAHANDLLVAYLVYLYSPNLDNLPVLSGGRVELARFDGQTLTPLAEGPSGCMLSWNRNADTLAYVQRDVAAVRLCEANFDTLNFLTSTQLQSFVLSQGQQAAALGWFTQSEDIATATPTPQRHLHQHQPSPLRHRPLVPLLSQQRILLG